MKKQITLLLYIFLHLVFFIELFADTSTTGTIEPTHVYNDILTLKKGKNTFIVHRYGIDTKTIFKNDAVQKVWLNDPLSRKTAVFPKENNASLLELKFIEQNTMFFVLAYKDARIRLQHQSIEHPFCLQKSRLKDYETVIDSANNTNKKTSFSKTHDLSLTSRYISNYKKNTYDDTKIAVIYKKKSFKAHSPSTYMTYGPAVPAVFLQYRKEYQSEPFFIYSFRNKKCYQGFFPSLKIPPFPTLHEISASN
jgi:hypothetical protein